MKLAILILMFCFSSLAANLKLKDYNWELTDITSLGYTKEGLFSRMDREFVKPSSSICSNRAHMWANNFKNKNQLDTAKIFLFYTKKKGDLSSKTWWYHVSPVVNEKGVLWTMDAGFDDWIKGPLPKEAWLTKFTQSTNCKEINANENELIELILRGQVFPNETVYGRYDCYYKIVPHTLWTPESVAKNLLGVDAQGKPVRMERSVINQAELFQACLESTSSKLGWALGSSKKKCEEYVGY